jgi:Spx/MgsR family transcriptional regulator
MLKVYGIKNCNKIRDTLKWLDEKDLEYEFVDVKKSPIPAENLADFTEKVGLDTLVNRRGMKWRQLGLAKKENLSEQELFDQLLEHQTMIKRPLIVKGEAIMVGYDEDAFESFIG